MVCVVGAGSPELALSGLRLFIAGAHAAYYGFSAIYWQAAGYSASAVGYLWSLGVVAEVIIFALSNKLFRRCSARDMLLISAICGVVRWGIMGATTALPWLIVVQILHCGTFTVCHPPPCAILPLAGVAKSSVYRRFTLPSRWAAVSRS